MCIYIYIYIYIYIHIPRAPALSGVNPAAAEPECGLPHVPAPPAPCREQA